ncbi:hypothetical protein C8J57DRAFT_1310710 [Mycena rebaudengoi]|nr:hypothetical protein C8J57DRAFT_1310710 [Mycena rebaudengoi]
MLSDSNIPELIGQVRLVFLLFLVFLSFLNSPSELFLLWISSSSPALIAMYLVDPKSRPARVCSEI